ncbi:MAG: tRNA(Ile)(2)-agmatinylcytidine synthase [Candidatus Bathyarchaeota archaeon]
MTKEFMHIGLDDTDSPDKGCTTYAAALLVDKLQKLECKFIDYPNLIRLNPNVPWKTRGNGALCIRIEYDESIEERIKEVIISTVEEEADLRYKGTDPGVIFLKGKKVRKEISEFAETTITGIADLRKALKLVKKSQAVAVGYKRGRGIIGSLAAIGETLDKDYTFELLAYRTLENRGSKRKIDESSVIEMSQATKPYTFNNFDSKNNRNLIAPRGPDPILLGIRGESPTIVRRAFKMIKAFEPVERWVIFRTNQGTDAHLRCVQTIKQIEKYNAVIVKGTVATNPIIIPRRHVIFSIKDKSGQVDCAAYEPTGSLRKTARKLIVGDKIEVFGGVCVSSKHPPTINLEKINLLKLVPKIILRNPICFKCGKRTKSNGKNKGFKCRRCSLKYAEARKSRLEVKREIKEGLYITSPRSQRHLTKPLRRYGMEKTSRENMEPSKGRLIAQWYGH